MRAISAAALAALAAGFLSGCGGSSLNGSPLAATPDSSPVIYGLNAQAAASGGGFVETSGVGFTDPTAGLTSVITGATGYKTDGGPGPLPLYQSAFATGIPLGFAADGAFVVGAGTAFPTNYTGNMTFRAYISTGVKNNNKVDLVPSSVVLTSSDDPTFSQQLTFDSAGIGNGPLGQGQYAATFPVPAAFKTSGLHNLHTVVADVQAQKSETDFAFVAVAPTDVALFLQSITVPVAATATAAATTTTTAITPGDTVTIDGGQGIGVYPTGYTPKIADAQGTVVFFVTPGTHTVTETDSKGAVVQTETFTLAADTAGTTLLAPPTPDGSVASARPLVIHPSARRAAHIVKH